MKYLLTILISFSVFIPIAHAAIAVDSTGGGSLVNATSQTTAFNNIAGDILIVGTFSRAQDVTGVTYNGVAMTQIGSSVTCSPTCGSDDRIQQWYLLAPATGSNNVVVSVSSANFINSVFTSYSDSKQSGQPDSSMDYAVQSVTSATLTTTTIADNSWLIAVGRGGSGSLTAGAGTTLRATSSGGGDLQLLDSNAAKTPAGSYSLVLVDATGPIWGKMISISPTVVASVSNPILGLVRSFWLF